MNEIEFTQLVKNMRQAQNEYFKSRQFPALQKARQIERAVDAEIHRRNKSQD